MASFVVGPHRLVLPVIGLFRAVRVAKVAAGRGQALVQGRLQSTPRASLPFVPIAQDYNESPER